MHNQILKDASLVCDYLVSPDDTEKRRAADDLVDKGLLRSRPNFSLTNFYIYEITDKGLNLLNHPQKTLRDLKQIDDLNAMRDASRIKC